VPVRHCIDISMLTLKYCHVRIRSLVTLIQKTQLSFYINIRHTKIFIHITGEATATTWFAGNKRLIKFLYPEIKLIMLVRDPAERFISHYNMLTRFHNEGRKGYDLGELSGFVDKEIASFNSNQKTRILSQGIYINELLEWRKLFGDQLLVLPTENLQSEDAHTVMDKVARYLNLSEFDFKDTVNVRYNSTGKKIGDSGELQRLKEFYRPYNVRLNEHFEIDLDKKLERYEN